MKYDWLSFKWVFFIPSYNNLKLKMKKKICNSQENSNMINVSFKLSVRNIQCLATPAEAIQFAWMEDWIIVARKLYIGGEGFSRATFVAYLKHYGYVKSPMELPMCKRNEEWVMPVSVINGLQLHVFRIAAFQGQGSSWHNPTEQQHGSIISNSQWHNMSQSIKMRYHITVICVDIRSH